MREEHDADIHNSSVYQQHGPYRCGSRFFRGMDAEIFLLGYPTARDSTDKNPICEAVAVMYDLFIITYLPSFYKINLYNAIAQTQKIFVLFIAPSSAIRNPDFCEAPMTFEHAYLREGNYEGGIHFSSWFRLSNHLRNRTYRRLLISGWDLPEFWLALLLSPATKNCLAVESTPHDDNRFGLKNLLKRIFLSRVDTVFASGVPQKRLVDMLGFKGHLILTGGVGLINRISHHKSTESYAKPFLDVGRLSPEKNITMEPSDFAGSPDHRLSIVGDGPLLPDVLEAAARCPNIRYHHHIDNHNLYHTYLSHDILVLPSQYEPWGLVVEEALYYGTSVIVSDQVGCSDDFVTAHDAGIVFNVVDPDGLRDAIRRVGDPQTFARLKANAARIDFDLLHERQVMSYRS